MWVCKERWELIEQYRKGQDAANDRLRDMIYALQGKIQRLEEYLGVTEVAIHKVSYQQKGGPEEGAP